MNVRSYSTRTSHENGGEHSSKSSGRKCWRGLWSGWHIGTDDSTAGYKGFVSRVPCDTTYSGCWEEKAAAPTSPVICRQTPQPGVFSIPIGADWDALHVVFVELGLPALDSSHHLSVHVVTWEPMSWLVVSRLVRLSALFDCMAASFQCYPVPHSSFCRCFLAS